MIRRAGNAKERRLGRWKILVRLDALDLHAVSLIMVGQQLQHFVNVMRSHQRVLPAEARQIPAPDRFQEFERCITQLAQILPQLSQRHSGLGLQTGGRLYLEEWIGQHERLQDPWREAGHNRKGKPYEIKLQQGFGEEPRRHGEFFKGRFSGSPPRFLAGPHQFSNIVLKHFFREADMLSDLTSRP